MADVKITKKEHFETLRALVVGLDDNQYDNLVEFIDNEIALLDKRSTKAKEKAAEKKAEGDELRKAILNVLSNEVQTVDQIVAQVPGEEVSKQKVVARLTQLVKSGEAMKDTIKVDKKKVSVYARVEGVADPEPVEE